MKVINRSVFSYIEYALFKLYLRRLNPHHYSNIEVAMLFEVLPLLTLIAPESYACAAL